MKHQVPNQSQRGGGAAPGAKERRKGKARVGDALGSVGEAELSPRGQRIFFCWPELQSSKFQS